MPSATELKIEKRRKETKVSVVKQNAKVPPWLRKKIAAAMRAQGCEVNAQAYRAYRLFQEFLEHVQDASQYVDHCGVRFDAPPCFWSRLFDHPGTTVIANQKCFVLEPYAGGGLRGVAYEQALDVGVYKMARLLGCRVTWSRDSWHYPDVAYRILFAPPADNLS